MTTSFPNFSTRPSNHPPASPDSSININEQMGVPLSLKNLATLLLFATNAILETCSTLTWNSKDLSSDANVNRRSPDFGEMFDLDVGPSAEVVSRMAPLPITTIRKRSFDLWNSSRIDSADVLSVWSEFPSLPVDADENSNVDGSFVSWFCAWGDGTLLVWCQPFWKASPV